MATDYTTLITSEHATQPNFVATVALLAGAMGAVADVASSLSSAFDVDAAVGAQLDAVGLWVGISRHQSVPIPNAFFSWNTSGLGWNQANWKGPYTPTEGVVDLDDDTYRAVIKAVIAKNYWEGTNESDLAQGNVVIMPPGVRTFSIDNLDMSITVYVVGSPVVVVQALIQRHVLPPKPAGVRVASYVYIPGTAAPAFGLDSNNAIIAGLDTGYVDGNANP